MEKEIMSLLNKAYDDIEETRNKKVKEEEQKKQEMNEFLLRASKNAQLVAMKILEKAIKESLKISNYFSSSYCVKIETVTEEFMAYHRDLNLMRTAIGNGKKMVFCSLNSDTEGKSIYIPVDIDMICLGNIKIDFDYNGYGVINQSSLENLMSVYLEGKSGLKEIMSNDLISQLQDSLKERKKRNIEIDNFFKTLKNNAYLIYCQLFKGIVKDCVKNPEASNGLRYSSFIDYVDINNRFVNTLMASQYLPDGMDKDYVRAYNHLQPSLTKKSIMYFRYDDKFIPAIVSDIINISKANDGGIIDFYYIERDGVLNAETYSIYFIKLMNKTKEQFLEEEKATVKNTK